jgi:hypothetical protein
MPISNGSLSLRQIDIRSLRYGVDSLCPETTQSTTLPTHQGDVRNVVGKWDTWGIPRSISVYLAGMDRGGKSEMQQGG